MESVIGAGILGNLQYDEGHHRWALELGIWSGSLSLAIHQEVHKRGIRTHTSSYSQAALAEIDALLSRHNVSYHTDFGRGDPKGQWTGLLDAVKKQKGAIACALVIIGGRMKVSNWRSPVEESVRALIDEIDRYCSELGMATESFGRILRSQPVSQPKPALVREDLERFSRLLVRLSKPLKVLVMSSDPRDADRLRIAEERRELGDALLRSRFRGSMELHDVAGCRVRDIGSTLDRYDPDILHFSGHGDNSALLFENDRGEAIAVDKVALANLLGSQKNLKLVILNACYSRDQAQAIANKVGYVVGMEGSILDDDSIAFSREFYAALGHGRTFEAAFERAKLVMALTTTMEPHLLKRKA